MIAIVPFVVLEQSYDARVRVRIIDAKQRLASIAGRSVVIVCCQHSRKVSRGSVVVPVPHIVGEVAIETWPQSVAKAGDPNRGGVFHPVAFQIQDDGADEHFRACH